MVLAILVLFERACALPFCHSVQASLRACVVSVALQPISWDRGEAEHLKIPTPSPTPPSAPERLCLKSAYAQTLKPTL